MSDIPNRNTFKSMYSGKAPWDIGRPQKAFIEAADQIQGAVLDAGCGTGENALFFAQRHHAVVGVDFLEFPIQEALQKGQERGLAVEFICMDALTLKTFNRKFDTVIDCGLFHVFSDDDRERYVAGLACIIKPEGRLFLMCFSDEEPGTQGPRRVSRKEIEEAFDNGWKVESIQPTRFEVRPDLKDFSFSEGGPFCKTGRLNHFDSVPG